MCCYLDLKRVKQAAGMQQAALKLRKLLQMSSSPLRQQSGRTRFSMLMIKLLLRAVLVPGLLGIDPDVVMRVKVHSWVVLQLPVEILETTASADQLAEAQPEVITHTFPARSHGCRTVGLMDGPSCPVS